MIAARARVEDEVLAADNAWSTAFTSCDTELMGRLLSDDLVFIHSMGKVDTKTSFMPDVKNCGLELSRSEEQKVRVYGDTAVVTGNLVFKRRGGRAGTLLYTRVFVKQHGAWRIVSHQSTDAPAPAPAPKS
jgi:ketosteroid isomerase-like protein